MKICLNFAALIILAGASVAKIAKVRSNKRMSASAPIARSSVALSLMKSPLADKRGLLPNGVFHSAAICISSRTSPGHFAGTIVKPVKGSWIDRG
jgi:hypothetical protein